MRKPFFLAVAFALLLSTFLFLQVPRAFATSWTPWSYDNAPASGPLTGQGATRWADDGSFYWQVDANSHASVQTSSSLSASVTGYDRCYNTDPWTERMYGDNTVYNGTYVDVGAQTGYFFDCGQDAAHSYQNFHEHLFSEDGGGAWDTSHSILY